MIGYVSAIEGDMNFQKNVKINQFGHVILAAEAARYNLGVTLINNCMAIDQNHQQNIVRILTYGYTVYTE